MPAGVRRGRDAGGVRPSGGAVRSELVLYLSEGRGRTPTWEGMRLFAGGGLPAAGATDAPAVIDERPDTLQPRKHHAEAA
ncbi:hypothetical protein GCM10010406_40250 [Streptomyces thermolineatus]|uniref:Uncharacterized protein n=1 Tax=Streptomyces thermolineatus TaxID=44033 RepID=A0ABN3MD51_9ACTN